MGTLVLPGRRPVTAYLALVVAPIIGLLAIFELGSGLPPSTGNAPAAGVLVPAANAVLNLPLFLIQLAVIIAVARALGLALGRLGQPQVVGEMVAGLLLGPSFLGFVAPAAYAWLFPVGTVR